MGPRRAFMKKTAIIAKGKNGDKALEILNIAAYFAPTNIRIGMFSSIILDRSELKAAISALETQSLVRCPKENKFFIPESVGVSLRNQIGHSDEKESILKKAIVVFSRLRPHIDYPHFLSFFKYAMEKPNVFKELKNLPGIIIMGMMDNGKYQEAVEFGIYCNMYLKKTLGEHHSTVLDLECILGLTLMMVNKKEDGIKLLTSAYKKACNFRRVNDIQKIMMVMLRGILNDTISLNPLQVFSENRVRSILFPGQCISKCNNEWDLKKWLEYARVLEDLGFSAQALSLVQDIIRRRLILFGQDDADIFPAMELKAIILANEPSKVFVEEALELLENIYEKEKKIFGPENEVTVRTLSFIGEILIFRGNLKKALSLFENITKSIHIKESDDISILIYEDSVKHMINICIIQENYARALKLSSDLLVKYESIYGETHSKCLVCRKEQKDLYLKFEKPQKALEVLKKIVEDYKYELEEEELECFNKEILMIENTRSFIWKWVEKNQSFDAPTGTLHSLAKEGNLEMLLSQIKSGKDIESKDSTGMTPLHYASAFGQVDTARVLIEKGAKNPSNALSGPTPIEVANGIQMKTLLKTVHSFYEAVKGDHINDLIDIALKEPCVLGAKDEQGCTPLHWAALHGYGDVFSLLMEFGSNPTVVSDKGNSPLHIAASKGHLKIAETILLMGNDEVTALLDGKTNNGGNTPLHAAAEKGHSAMVRVFLSHGAVWSTKNSAGKPPRQVSENWDCKNLLGLVESLFLDTGKGDVGAVCAKLRDLECGDMLAIRKARDGDHRNLLQVAIENKNFLLVKKLVKLLKYVPSDR